ncbi:hypothetical protein V8Z74_14515 [Comamonas sp. w2-DMI]|uniref:hypothetical protein n=1 Tax=Comamonas sp. w2-DMI TaxID=3126391 RepID=UPI0032E39117
MDALVNEVGKSSIVVAITLASSPIVFKLEHSIYCVNGRPFPLQAYADAQERRKAEQLAARGQAVPLNLDPTKPITLEITQSNSIVSAGRRVVYLPAYAKTLVEGKFSHSCAKHRQISVMSHQQIRGLSQVAEEIGVNPGERFEVTFDLAGRTYSLRKLASI